METNISKREVNKTQHKASILDAAEKLFIQRGFENTSIDDVAKEARLTKRTLYQYFTSKEDLFFAVALIGAKLLTFNYEEALKRGRTALEKIRWANKAYFEFYKEYEGMFRLLNYQPANQQNCADSPHYRELQVISGIRMKCLRELVEEGRADGSINAGLDTKQAVFFAFYCAYSLLCAASSSDRTMWEMLNLNEEEFLKFSFDLLANALK